MTEKIVVKEIDATALDPSKKYIIKLKRGSFSENDAVSLLEALKMQDFKDVILVSLSEDSDMQIVESS